MSEAQLSQQIMNKSLGAMRIENAVGLGTPDICLPTRGGWTWLELKKNYSGKILGKKTQHASMVREVRTLPEHFHRYIVVLEDIRPMTVSLFRPVELMDMEMKPADKEVHYTMPKDRTIRELDDVLGYLGVYMK